MTLEELRELPLTVDLVTAGRAHGLGRTISYELICALGRRLPRLYRDGSESFPETSRA